MHQQALVWLTALKGLSVPKLGCCRKQRAQQRSLCACVAAQGVQPAEYIPNMTATIFICMCVW